MLLGYSSFFTTSDVRRVDDLLVAAPVDPSSLEILSSLCTISKGADPARASLSLTCAVAEDGKGLQFSSFIRTPEDTGMLLGSARQLRFIPGSSACDPIAFATPDNISRGIACPQIDNVVTRARPLADGSWQLYFQTSAGISVRLLDGRRLMPVMLPTLAAGETKNVRVQFQLIRDFDPLLKALQTAFDAGGFKRYVDGKALNRLSVMNMVLAFMGSPTGDFSALTHDLMTLKKVSEAPGDELSDLPLKESERAVALLTHTCGACHYNRDGVPPAYLGGPRQVWTPLQKCQHVATCAGRILYRLKMWDCPVEDAQVKKSPMPPMSRMKAMNVDLDVWKKTDRKDIFTHLQSIFPKNEVLGILQQQGVSSADAQTFVTDLTKLSCPTAMSAMFEKLPRCDDSYSLGADLCK